MLLSSPLFLGAAASLLLVAYVVRCVTSPIWRVPGQTITAFTSLVIKWHELNANRTKYIHGLHEKYGPVVRVAPNEVCFTSAAAVKEIYSSSGSGYDKTEFYDLFQNYGRRTMFSTLNKGDHAKRKRILGDRYANSNVMRGASLTGVQERSQRFIERCLGAADGTPDIFMALHAYACDCITNHLFHPHGTDCIRKEKDEEMMGQVAGDDSLQNRLVFHYSPVFHHLISRALYLFAKPRETPLADNFVIEAAQRGDTSSFTLLSRLEEKGTGFDKIDMAAECIDHMAAGIDTTGDALCFLMWELSQPRSLHLQRRLQEELRENRHVPLEDLKFLEATINEGLRCFPAIPMSLPRYVPPGGRSIDGYALPEKTVVSCQAFSVHRINQHVFPDPELFSPDRWLAAEGDVDRKRLMFAFSSGGRGCIGKHLALAEMKTLLRDVYSQYSTEPAASMRKEAMAMSDQLISSRPLGQKCLLKFMPLDVDE